MGRRDRDPPDRPLMPHPFQFLVRTPSLPALNNALQFLVFIFGATRCQKITMAWPIAPKAFQQKIKKAEDFAQQHWLPRAHSCGPGEGIEQLPMWVKVFHEYFEEEKVQATRLEAKEEARIQIRTLRRTIVPPPEPLGSKNATTALQSEQATV